jgi:hypothetical protein
MATAQYYRKQVELLLVWAMATTKPDLKAKLIEWALKSLAFANSTDNETLRLFQEERDQFNAQQDYPHSFGLKPGASPPTSPSCRSC